MEIEDQFIDINFTTCFLTFRGEWSEISKFMQASENKAKRTRQFVYHCANDERFPFERYLSFAYRGYTHPYGYGKVGTINNGSLSVCSDEVSATESYIFGIEGCDCNEHLRSFKFKTLNYLPILQIMSMASRFDLEITFSYFSEREKKTGVMFYTDGDFETKMHFRNGGCGYESVINLFNTAGINVYDEETKMVTSSHDIFLAAAKEIGVDTGED